MDPEDPFLKAPGPVVVRRLPHELVDGWATRPPALESFEKDDVGWAYHKSYWIGHRPRAAAPGGLQSLPAFTWDPPTEREIRRTRLNEQHRKLGAKMAPFAGYDMPIQYSSVLEEHQAVRRAAGLFDVSHMGLFEFSGENVYLFLHNVGANDVATIKVGGSQYSFLLAPDGSVIDDIWVYRLDRERYWVVVNASNNDKDWAWLNAMREARVMIDPVRPWTRALGYDSVVIRDLRDPLCGEDQRAQLALQGPKSREILLAMAGDDHALRAQLLEMQRTQIAHGVFLGYDVWFARTGYTGEPMAFELFLHPDDLPSFWRDTLRVGAPLGLKPIGLAARDSLRIEAGLPLYGHELAGPLGLNPADAGFAPYVKLYKPFFIGKAAYEGHEAKRQARLARFRVDEEHGPMLGQGDVIVNNKGRVVGHVTSCSIDTEGRQVGLAYLQDPHWQRGTKLGVYRLGNRNWESRALNQLQPGDRVQLPDAITIIDRFLNKS
jgi:glycine hydroxymethyltransferase